MSLSKQLNNQTPSALAHHVNVTDYGTPFERIPTSIISIITTFIFLII